MMKNIYLALSFFVFLGCLFDSQQAGTVDNVDTATIYYPDGTPAPLAKVSVYKVNDTTRTPVQTYTTNNQGELAFKSLPKGEYNVIAQKTKSNQESLVAYTESVLLNDNNPQNISDTLETSLAITGLVGLQKGDDPRTVTVQALGSNFYSNVNASGHFTLTGLARGNYTLALKSTLPGYTDTYEAIKLNEQSPDTLTDTLDLIYTGIPLVEGLVLNFDSITGAVNLNWKATSYPDLLEYLIYRDNFDALEYSQNIFAVANSIGIKDYTYSSIPLSEGVTKLKYRIAIRNNKQEKGKTYKYEAIEITRPSQVYVPLVPQAGKNFVGKFEWQPIPSAQLYHLMVSTNIDFTDTVYTLQTKQNQVTLQTLTPGNYFWKFRAQNQKGEWGPSSEPVEFVEAGPPAPKAMMPIDTTFNSTSNPLTFKWEAVSGATQYQIQVSRMEDYSILILDTTVSNTQFEKVMPTGGFYWKLRTKNSFGVWGNWSGNGLFNHGVGITPTKIEYGGPDRAWLDARTSNSENIVLNMNPFGAYSTETIILKIDSYGKKIWEYSNSPFGWGKKTIDTKDGGTLILSTYIRGFESDSSALINLDSDGKQKWISKLGSFGFSPQDIIQTPDEGYVVVGNYKKDFHSKQQGFIYKFDKNGVKLWEKWVEFYSSDFVSLDSNGQTLVIGKEKEIFDVDSKTYILKLNTQGDSINTTFFETGMQIVYSVKTLKDNSFLFTLSGYGVLSFKHFNSNGILTWSNFFEPGFSEILGEAYNDQARIFSILTKNLSSDLGAKDSYYSQIQLGNSVRSTKMLTINNFFELEGYTQSADGESVLFGVREGYLHLIKLDKEGNAPVYIEK